jgi:hypothetical protein
MEEVVRNMLARDLRITVASPAFSATGTVSAFSISFSYSDPRQAQRLVQTLLTAFQEDRLNEQRELAKLANRYKLNQILERKAGENLEVLDPPSFAERPVGPNRVAIAAAGLGVGLLLGAITLGFRRPRTPALQPA